MVVDKVRIKGMKLKRGTGLVVVAHPDDETIWMGGTILMNPQVRWTILSLCRKNDTDRRPRFFQACVRYKAQGKMGDLEDEGKLNIQKSIPIAAKLIKKLLSPKLSFDYLFTHAANGEYGHPRHKGTHRAVKYLLDHNALRARERFQFSYKLDTIKSIGVPRTHASIRNLLPEKIFQKKRSMIRDIYGFSATAFETLSAGRVETFDSFT